MPSWRQLRWLEEGKDNTSVVWEGVQFIFKDVDEGNETGCHSGKLKDDC